MRKTVFIVFVFLFALACATNQTLNTSDTETANASSDTPISTEIIAPLIFVKAPEFGGNENPAVPQAGILFLETSIPSDVTIEVSGSDGEEWQLNRPATPLLEMAVLGLRPQTEYTVSVTATSETQTIFANAGTWQTPPLPDDFPPLDIAISAPEQMAPGMIQFNVWNGLRGDDKLLIIVDNSGIVRWYYWDAPVFDDHRRLQDGNFLFAPDECLLYKVDALGNLVRSWHATRHPVDCEIPADSIPVNIESFHHSMTQLENGNMLVLSTEIREIDNFPTDEDNADAETETQRVMASVIVEFTQAGDIVKQIPLMDLLDPTRIGRGVLRSSWTLINKYKETAPTVDWDHANALIYDGASDAYLLSLRHQDAVIKVNRASETLEWILGTPANWQSPWDEKLLTPDDSVEWFYHSHAVTLTERGLGLYDNGNYGAPAFEPRGEEFSRAVLFSIDEDTHTVSQLWQYGAPSGDQHFYSSAMGNAVWQDDHKNVLLCNGYLNDGNGAYAQVLEVTESGERVFEMNVKATDDSAHDRYAMHRARRIGDIRF